MGSSSSFQQLAGKLEKAARGIETRSDEEIVGKDALRAKKLIAAQMAMAAPKGTMHVGSKRSARVGVRYDLAPGKKGAIVRATGPVHLLERDTPAHSIPRLKGTRRTYSATGRKLKKASTVRKVVERPLLVINGRVRTGPVTHPGTKGKHPFQKGVRRFLPGVGEQLEKNVDRIMRGIF